MMGDKIWTFWLKQDKIFKALVAHDKLLYFFTGTQSHNLLVNKYLKKTGYK